MTPSSVFQHTNGYQSQRFRCPLLFPHVTGETWDHEQFTKRPGCVKDPTIEPGGLMRVLLDHQAEDYKAIYRQRSTDERLNSQAKALGLERPRVRNAPPVANLNTLTYVVINVHALDRDRTINARSTPPPALC